MNIYAKKLEETIYLYRKKFSKDPPPVKQTHLLLRLILWAFTFVCIGAVVGLFTQLFNFRRPIPLGFMLGFFSLPFYFLGEYLIVRFQFYRHGIEEALTLGGLALFCGALLIFINETTLNTNLKTMLGASAVCVVYYCAFSRLGYFLAALVSVTALCFIPLPLLTSEAWQRTFLVILFSSLFYFNAQHLSHLQWKFETARHQWFEAVLLVAGYIFLNVRFFNLFDSGLRATPPPSTAGVPVWFYWSTYAAVFIAPIWGIYYGLKKRRRATVDVSLLCLLGTLITNKSYLQLARYDWDPAILGVFLAALALSTQKWLSTGNDKTRHGLTCAKRSDLDTHGLDAASLGPVLAGPDTPGPQENSPFAGGQSGGGGASGSF